MSRQYGNYLTPYQEHSSCTKCRVQYLYSIISLSTVVDLLGYDVQNSSSRSTPITQKGSNIKDFVCVLVSVTTRDWS